MNDPKKAWSISGPVRLGGLAAIVLLAGFGTWSTQTEMAGAVVATGQIEVERNRQAIQHPDGGVVAELLVEEGASVAAGEVVLQLDGSELASELAVVTGRLNELAALRTRLEAERDGATALNVPEDLIDAASADPSLAEILADQSDLFQAGLQAFTQEVDQLTRRQDQIAAQIIGLEAQAEAAEQQLQLIADDLAVQQDLRDRGLGQAARVISLQREEAGLFGQAGEIEAGIHQAEGQATEIELVMLRMATERREAAIAELREVRAEEQELGERARALTRRLDRRDLRAPVSGVVYGLSVAGAQSVVRSAEPVMYLVPQDQPLVISSRIETINIDEVFVGQEARLVFPAFDIRTTPELTGAVTRVSADAFVDEATGISYYEAEIVLSDGEIEKLGERILLPGMPVDAFIRTADRSPLDYLLSPLTSYFDRAFRES